MKTSSGVELNVQRIDRRVIDEFTRRNPLPEPPTKEVTLYGGFIDTVEDYDDEEYLAAMLLYRMTLAEDQLDILADVITVLGPYGLPLHDYGEYPLYQEKVALDIIPPNSKVAFLRHVALQTDADMDMVIGEILYLSTTTERGIEEAEQMFAATWSEMPLSRLHTKRTPGSYSRYYEDREAARFAHYNWGAFCELDGPEQSAVIAHYRTTLTLEYHNANWRNKK